MSDPRVVPIPQPVQSVEGMFEAVLALKHAVEILSGQTGPVTSRSPSWQELVDIGLIQADQIPR